MAGHTVSRKWKLSLTAWMFKSWLTIWARRKMYNEREGLCFSGESTEQKSRELPLKNPRMQTHAGRSGQAGPGQNNYTGQTKLQSTQSKRPKSRSHEDQSSALSCFNFLCATVHHEQGSPNYRGFTIILRYTTLGTIPVDEWSARRRDLYLTTHTTHNRQP